MTLLAKPPIHLKKGIFWMLLATLFNALTAALAKQALSYTSVEMLVFGRSFVGLVILAGVVPLLTSGVPFREKWFSEDKKMHLVRGIGAIASIYLTFYALEFLDVADVMILSNTLPIFIPFTLYLWKKVPIQHVLWWGIGLSFLGVIILLHPGSGIFGIPSLMALLAAMTGSVAVTALRYAHFKESSVLTLFYYFLITFVVSSMVTLFSFRENWTGLTSTTLFWLFAVGMSGFGWQVTFTLATKYAPVRMITPLLYLSVVYSVFIDWWIWNRGISFLEAIGFLCVILGACLVVFLYKGNSS